jgi:hypothetical protein
MFKTSPKTHLVNTLLALTTGAITLTNISGANAAIVAVGAADSWITGTNTLSNLGFNMVTVPDPALPESSSVTTLSSPVGDLTFGTPTSYLTIGNGWASWSNGYTGEVYFSEPESNTITLTGGITAFDFYLEPNIFDLFQVTVTAQDGTTITQDVNGSGGAEYFGFYGTAGSLISSVTISAPNSGGFAVGQIRLAGTPNVPEPASVLGILAIGILGTGSALKRKLK